MSSFTYPKYSKILRIPQKKVFFNDFIVVGGFFLLLLLLLFFLLFARWSFLFLFSKIYRLEFFLKENQVNRYIHIFWWFWHQDLLGGIKLNKSTNLQTNQPNRAVLWDNQVAKIASLNWALSSYLSSYISGTSS